MRIKMDVEISTNGEYCETQNNWCKFLYSEEIHHCYLFDKILKLSEWDEKEHERHCIRCEKCLEATK